MRFFKRFRAVYEQYREHDGKPFTLLRTFPLPEGETEFPEQQHEIRLSTGETITAWPEEVAPFVAGDDEAELHAEYGAGPEYAHPALS
jgi:hypothetical protein